MAPTNKKEDLSKPQNAFLETRNLEEIAAKTGNLYKSINVMAKRSEQINAKMKEELHRKLEEFASATDNLEEVFENREQIEISRYYEKIPKTSILALNEFLADETYYRDTEAQ
jgi:DNA-directed RNA polymerase subunit K/omega